MQMSDVSKWIRKQARPLGFQTDFDSAILLLVINLVE